MRRLLLPLPMALTAILLGCDVVPIPPTGETAARAVPGGPGSGAAPDVEDSGPDGGPDRGPDGGPESLGEGFLVWESNRTGQWRIWTRPLEGGAARQLTPDERGRQHYAPHISPDGRLVAYLSARDSGRRYPEGGVSGSLRLIDLESGETRQVVDGARTYFENRSVVWRSPRELIYIGDDLKTRLLDIESGETRLLTTEPASEMGYLIDGLLRFASSNSATFSIYESGARRVVPRANLGGCQPYFSHDGRWGVWTAGAGGPIQKMELESRHIGKVLDKNDPRMPDGLGYMYFPMLSRDGSLLALAASRNEHDHFTSDYEVFVVEVDPETLETVGPPRRFTENPATDRYPDVHRSPLALGRHRGEAPFEVDLAAPGGGVWRWDSGDGAAPRQDSRFRHRYERPGAYTVEARRGEEVIRGRVVVAAARPPRILASHLSGDGRHVVVEFDEPVSIESAVLSRESGSPLGRLDLDDGGRVLSIDLESPLEGVDRLSLEGVIDRAAEPNTMERAGIDIGPLAWPAVRRGLVFAWQTGDAANLVADAVGSERAIALTRSGPALLDRFWAMRPGDGRFEAAPEDAARVKAALQGSNEMTIEATLRSARGSKTFLVASADPRRLNFRLERRGATLGFRARVGNKGPGSQPLVDLFTLPERGPVHVAVTYSPAHLVAYLNGEKRFEAGADVIRGDFFHWRNLPLTFGEGTAGDTRLEGVAIFDRVLAADEVEAQYQRYRLQMAGRRPVAGATVRARLVTTSPAPGLDQISPYREALVVSEYEVLEVVSGTLVSGKPDLGKPGWGRIRVAHWAILDAERLALNDRPVGAVYRLSLQPFDANPQLASLYLGQADAIDGDLPLFHSPALRATPERRSASD